MNYKTERNSQGHLVVRDVEIFMDCQRVDREGVAVFDRAWVEAAVKQAREAAEDKYCPPLHVRHHGPGEQVRPAGFFEITRCEEITFRGKQRLAIFADLTITEEGVEWDVIQARLPYRSVEIMSVKRPKIDSLALLDHEPPYLEFPLMMVNDPGPRGEPEVAFASATFAQRYTPQPSPDDDGLVVCFRRGESATILFDQREEPTMAAKKQTKPTQPTDPAKKARFAADGDKPDDGDGDGKGDGEKMEGGDGEGLDVSAVCKAIQSGAISVADMDAIVAAIAAQKGAAEGEGELDDPTAIVPASIPGAAMSKKQNDDQSTKMARLQARCEVLEAKARDRDEADQRRDDVATAMQRLEGKPMGADLEERLNTHHREHGPKAFAAYVDEIVNTFGAYEGVAPVGDGGKPKPKVSAAVDKYAAGGPGVIEKAMKFSAQWGQLKEAGYIQMTEERYLALNMGEPAEPAA